MYIVFFFNDTATTDIYTLSLHDALPICTFRLDQFERARQLNGVRIVVLAQRCVAGTVFDVGPEASHVHLHVFVFRCLADRKSTRLNSSHSSISYAVFCLKKKNNTKTTTI